MKFTFAAIAVFTVGFSAFLALPTSAATVNYFWNNSGTDMNSASSYSRVDTGEVSAVLPDSDDLVWFDGLPQKQPHLMSDLTIGGIRFASTNDVSKGKFYASTEDGLNGYNHCGWVITGEVGVTLRLAKTANMNQSENNQALLNHCSYGTNRIECAVVLPDSGVKLSVDKGKLFLDGPVTLPRNNGCLRIMDSKGEDAALVLAAANPGLCGHLQLNNCNIAFAHPEAIGNIWRLTVASENGSGTPRYIWNMTGGEFTNTVPVQIWMGKCERTVFAGPPMRFPNAVLCPDSGSNHAIWVSESLTVGAVSNRNDTAGATAGRYSALDYYGDGSLHVLGDFGPNDLPGVTNVLHLLGGTVVFHDSQTVAATPVAVGKKGTNSRRPRLGITQNLRVKSGLVPGGEVFFYENCKYAGWAAYGCDHTVTMEALTDGVLKFRGWKGDETGLSANLNWGGSSDWWLVPAERLSFGAQDADGTITLFHDIDLNMGDSNAHFLLSAYQGDAFIAGRLAGCITNSYQSQPARQIRKEEGDGAVAIDGQVFVTGDHYVSSGGLLFNGVTAGSVTAKTGGWLGGTGMVQALSIECGGALRPGERGGTLTSDGKQPRPYALSGVTFADGSKFIVDVDNTVNGCLKLTGSSVDYKANGTITVVPCLVGELTHGRTVKILDWQDVSNPKSSTLFDLANWTVDADPEVFSRVGLSIDGSAMYLSVRPKVKPGLLILIR